MSLYLTIFDGDEEVTGWVFGHYSDFEYFRDVIAARLASRGLSGFDDTFRLRW